MTEATQKRLAALRERMRNEGVDLLALGPGTHMQWLLGFFPHPDERPCLLLINEGGETFLMPSINVESSREHSDISMHGWDDADGPDAALTAALDAIGGSVAKSVVLDETMRADFALLLLDRLPGAAHQFTDATLGALRMRKDADEFARLKENALINDRAMQAAFAAARPGVSELEIAAAIRAHYKSERRRARIHDCRLWAEQCLSAPPHRSPKARARRCHRRRYRRPQGRLSERHDPDDRRRRGAAGLCGSARRR